MLSKQVAQLSGQKDSNPLEIVNLKIPSELALHMSDRLVLFLGGEGTRADEDEFGKLMLFQTKTVAIFKQLALPIFTNSESEKRYTSLSSAVMKGISTPIRGPT
nr:MAG: hypothetical protein DIU57_16245 [Pseudomonadota bacterium]